MKAILSYAGFGSALNGVIKAAVVKSPGMAHTEAVKIVANANGLTLSGANQDITVHLHVPASVLGEGVEIIEEGTVIVPAKVLDSILKKMPGLIEFTAEDSQLVLSSGKTRFNMPTLPESTSWLRDATPLEKVSVNGKAFKHALNGVLFAVSKNESRPVLTGIHFAPSAEGTVVEATDGFALGRILLPGVQIPECIVSGDTMKSVLGTLSDDELVVGLETSYMVIEDGPNKLDVRLLDGTYPNTAGIIKIDDKVSIKVNTAEFKAALERCAVIATNDNHPVLVTVENGVCRLFAQEQGYKNEEEVPLSEQNGDISVSFNINLFISALKSMGANTVIKFGGPNRPCGIHTPEDENVFALLAPVMRR